MTIYVCETVYHVLLAMLLVNGKDNVVICTTHEKKNMENFKKLHMEQFPGVNFFLRFRDSKKESIGIEMLRDKIILRKLRREFNFRDFTLVNFAWSINSIDRSSTIYYKAAKQVILYEEGAMGSIGIPQNNVRLLVKRLLGIPVQYYNDEKLSAVYVQNPSLYDDRFGSKLKRFDLSQLVYKSEIGSRVVELFLDDKNAKTLRHADGKVIIFTQPLSEDGYITETEKIDIYSSICKFFLHNEVILKTHPRDTTEYLGLGVEIIRDSFPSELFNILQIRFKAAIGVCTSAVNNVEAKYKININPDFLKDRAFSNDMIERKLVEIRRMK